MKITRLDDARLKAMGARLSRVEPVEKPADREGGLTDRLPKPMPAESVEPEPAKKKRFIPYKDIPDLDRLTEILDDPSLGVVMTWREAEDLKGVLRHVGISVDVSRLDRQKFSIRPRPDDVLEQDRLA